MKNTVLYSNREHYLIERRSDNGKIKEYVCCSYYDPETDSWYWGHYFQTLTAAGKFFYEEWEHPEEKINTVPEEKINTVWVLNGTRDEGWEPELFDSKEKVIKAFKDYVEEYKEAFECEPVELEEDMARFETDEKYATFWFEKMRVQ